MTTYTPRHAQPTHSRRWSRQGLVAASTATLLILGATPAHAQTVREAQAPSVVVAIRGNTLSGLAARWCGSASAYHGLAAGNGINNPNLIYVGQRIRITCTAVRPASTTASRSNPVRTTPLVSGWVHPVPGARTTDCWGAGRNHKGIDIAAPQGTPIRAVGAGTVSNTGWIGTGYGLEVMISHGGVWSHYAHLSRTAVTRGQHITAGQIIGYVGHTGDARGNHLHFEIATRAGIYGAQLNPAPWLRSHGVVISC